VTTRYFIRLAYNGADYSGWQIQPNAPTVQATIEEALAVLYSGKVGVVGCGRTDTAVHASDYYLHLDVDDRHSKEDLLHKLNSMVPNSIVLYSIKKVADDAHTRFDAISRSYVYKLTFENDPFRPHTVYRFDQAGRPDFDLMNDAAKLLLEYESFFPFCKTHADSETYLCAMKKSEWQKVSELEWHYHVTSNRFLRGMVRMIVGMTLNVGLGRLDIETVKEAMDNQTRLVKAWSVPAKGLFLSNITYPDLS